MQKNLFTLAFVLFLGMISHAQNKQKIQVEAAVNKLIKAMEDGDSAALSSSVSKKLSYGHSGGKVENKQEFVHTIVSGASDFVKITISDQTIDIFSKKIAIVRHILEADTNDNNKPGHVKLKIMTVWKKAHGHWIMIARQAVH
jgi:hypothetical protein